MKESDLVGSYMGYSLPGTPNTTADDAFVYTKKISTFIDTICGAKACKDADGEALDKQGVKNKYIKHTIAHETGHMMNLRGGCTTDSGCHYPSQTNVILDASVSYVNSGGGKKFYIGSPFTPEDGANVRLR
jgi:predicted Zn-dependent protease